MHFLSDLKPCFATSRMSSNSSPRFAHPWSSGLSEPSPRDAEEANPTSRSHFSSPSNGSADPASSPAPYNVQGPQRLVHEWTHGLPATADTCSAQELRGYAHLYLKNFDSDRKSRLQLLCTAVLPRERFNDMFRASCDEDPRGLYRIVDPYKIFTTVVSEYGDRMDPVRPALSTLNSSILCHDRTILSSTSLL